MNTRDEKREKPHVRAARPQSAYGRIAAVRDRLRRGVAGATTDGKMVDDLAEAASHLERVHAVALQMQEGAESFDNIDRARLYGGVQAHLLAAAAEMERASLLLESEHRRTLLATHLPKAEVLDRLRRSHADLETALSGSTAEQMTDVSGGSPSIAERIGELVERERHVLGRLRAALDRNRRQAPSPDRDGPGHRPAGDPCPPPAADVLEQWRASYREVLATVEAMTDDDFAPDGRAARALGESLHLALAYGTYGRYAEVEAAVRRRIEGPGS